MIGIRSNVTVTVREAKTGRVVFTYQTHNKVVNDGLDQVRDLLGNFVLAPTHIAVGTGVTVPTASDSVLDTEVFRNVITARDPDPQKITFQLFLDTVDANGNTLSEAGIFNAAASGVMFSRVLISPVIIKTALVTATLTFEYTISEG